MAVAQGYRQGIGRIALQYLLQTENRRDHVLHLGFTGVTPTHDGFFDHGRSIFKNGDLIQ